MVSQKEVNKLKKEGNTFIDNIFEEEQKTIIDKIQEIFQKAITITKKLLNSNEEVTISNQEKQIFTDLIGESIKGLTDEYKQELNTSLNIGLSQQESISELKQRVDAILQGDNPTKLKYKNRLNLIVRTESSRIFNAGTYKTSKQLGAKYKYLIGVNDNRQAKDSDIALNKYGSPKKAISIDEYFTYYYNGKQRKFLFPPDRPNDRSTCIFLFEKPSN